MRHKHLFMMAPVVMGGKNAYLAYDSFTRADGVLGNSEASGPLGKATVRAWTDVVGTWAINTNQAQCSVPAGNSFAAVDVGVRNVSVSADVTCAANTGVIASCVDGNNTIIAFTNAINAYLYKCVGGVNTELIALPVTYVEGAPVKVVVSGTSVSLYYNSIQVGTTQTIDDAGLQTGTKAGLFTGSNTARMDNFQVM